MTPQPPPKAVRPQKRPGCIDSPDFVERLYQACKAGDDFGVHKFLETPVDPDGVSPSENQTPLMAATARGSVTIVELLLKYGADVNKDVKGQTAMIVAHSKGKKEVLRVLFGAAFLSLESVVGGGPAAGGPRRRQQKQEIDDDSHFQDLRDVTAKLASLNTKESGRAIDDDQRSVLSLQPEEPVLDDESHDRLREEVVRETMKALLNASSKSDR